MFLAFAKGLGVDDDLVLLVHRGDPVIALDRALAGGHLGAFVIGDVALHFLVPFPPGPSLGGLRWTQSVGQPDGVPKL